MDFLRFGAAALFVIGQGVGWVGVFDVHEVEAFGGDGGAGAAAVFGVEKFGDVGGGEFAAADFHEGADHFADHVTQERFAADDVFDFAAADFAAEFGGVDDADHVAFLVVFFGAGGRGEGGEIVLAGEFSGGGIHGGFVERPGIEKNVAVIERKKDGAAGDAVFVRFGLSQPAGVESLADFLGGDDADGMRQHGIHAALKFGGGEIGMRFEVGDLAQGVDSPVGAAGAVNGHALLGDFLEGVFEGALDGGDFGLELPAVEVGAVVGDGEFDVLQ